MSKFLVRINAPQRDKDNREAGSWEEALEALGKQERDKYKEVKWMNFTDHFFIGTDNYIREIN